MRRWLSLCLTFALLTVWIPAGGFAEGGRASTPLNDASAGQRENIDLAVAALDGALVRKGEIFSFNAAVGPRTRENGYVSAINGRGAKKLGGGVSQVAATLYLALKRMGGIQYLQKLTYGNQFSGTYVDSGYDAVITDYKHNVDFRFVNGYGDFTIRIWTTDVSVECELTGPGDPAQTVDTQGGTTANNTGENAGETEDVAPANGEAVAPDGIPASGPGGNEGTTANDSQANGDAMAPDDTQATNTGETVGAAVDGAPTNGTGGNEDTNADNLHASGDAMTPDSTQANGSIGNADAASEDAPTNPAPEDAGVGEPVVSDIADDPDVAGSSRIRVSGPDAMLENIQLASSGIYGVVLRSGETFSFNTLVGPNTEEAGYRKAPDGRGKEVVGGGVSVIASALWLAVRDMDGIDVTRKNTYGAAYSQSYVGDPDDAILTDHEKGVDFRFRYNGRGSITIYTYVLDGELLCEIRHNNS